MMPRSRCPPSPGRVRRAYDQFKKWREDNGYETVHEDMMLIYFEKLAEKVAASSLRPVYSMLKSTLNANEGIDISNYEQLISFLKDKNVGHVKNESKSFTRENLAQFLSEAPDEVYLATKVALIFGVAGALKRQDFVDIKLDDILDGDGIIFIKTPNVKDEVPRFFTIDDEILYSICKKYIEIRPSCDTNRFFLRYVEGKCMPTPIGINSFASMPQAIAKFLGLPDAEKFTGHSFRKTPANFLVEAVRQMKLMRRHDKPKSSLVSWDVLSDPLSNEQQAKTKSAGIGSVKMLMPHTNYINSSKSNQWIELSDLDNDYEVDEEPSFDNEPNVMVESVEPHYSHEPSTTSEQISPADRSHGKRKNITITKDEIIETISIPGHKKRVISHKPRMSNSCQSDGDFQEQDECFNSNKSFVFNNCNVTIVDGSHNTFVFNNCNINNTTKSIQN